MRDKPYQEILGAVQFGAAACHPDITHAANVLSQSTHDPRQAHWVALVHLLKYIGGTRDLGVTYSKDSPSGLTPITYVDADYAACLDTCHSVSGVVTIITGGPVFWMSKRQPVVALSTTEAEYIVLAKAVQQARWMHQFLSEAGHSVSLPSLI